MGAYTWLVPKGDEILKEPEVGELPEDAPVLEGEDPEADQEEVELEAGEDEVGRHEGRERPGEGEPEQINDEDFFFDTCALVGISCRRPRSLR